MPDQQLQEPKETIKTKIVAFWFVLVGIFGILISLGSLAVLLFTMLQLSQLGVDFIFIIFFVLAAVGFFTLSFYSFKISSLIHRLDREGYRTAMLYLITMMGGSLLTALGYVFTKQAQYILLFLPAISINAVIVYILYAERSLFEAKPGPKIFKKMLIVLAILFFLITPLGFYIKVKTEQFAVRQERLAESQRQAALQKIIEDSKKREKEIISWERYKNEQFGFELEYPSGWFMKIYPPEYWTQWGGAEEIVIAFAEKEMPKYWSADIPYFWISIYQSDEQNFMYQNFRSRMSKIGTSLFFSATLGGEKGVDNGLSIAVQHGGYVYELSLHSVLDENLNLVYSDISKKIWSSFKFIK